MVFMLALIAAGEIVFGLAFNVPRFFRPTMLEVFDISNTELGDMFAAYGVAAMIAYFPGGALADRFSARALITTSLVTTALGGFYMVTIPGATGMTVLYAYFGVTTIFLFWGALIRATREWGGQKSQGAAFGILEGGRGLVAASVAFIGVGILSVYLPDDANLATAEERLAGFRAVVLFYTAVTLLIAAFAWFSIPKESRGTDVEYNPLQGMGIVIRRPIVWAQAGVIICAYCGYKGLDNYSLYANQILGMDEVQAAKLAAYGAWTRPVAAILGGLISDRFNATRSIGVMFAVLCLSYAAWSMLGAASSGLAFIYFNFFATYIGVYALRGVYFALLEENRTPQFLTGAAVGLISLVGYTPDVFFGPITGRILDANPGLAGFQHYFQFLSAAMVLGILMVAWVVWLRRHGGEKLWQFASGKMK